MNLPIEPKRKGELFQLFQKYGFDKNDIRSEIIEVIQELRKVSKKEAQDTKMLFPNEVKEIYSRYKLDYSA